MARASRTGNRAGKAKAGTGKSSLKRGTASTNTRHKRLSVAALRRQLEGQSIALEQALEQQKATANVLRAISRSAFDLQNVLDKLTESACRLCDAYDAVLLLREDKFLRIAAHCGEIPVVDKWPISRDWISGRCVVDRMPIHIHDLLSEGAEFPRAQVFAQQTGHRSLFAVPLMRDSEAIGAITIRRTEVQPFTSRQIELLQTFADQAVIAIENKRLFNEVQQRTEDLSESLQQQTATADVLKVISRSTFDVQTVLDTLVESATRLCGADHAYLFQRDGNLLSFKSSFGQDIAIHEALRKLLLRRELPINRESIVGRSALEGCVVHVADVLKDPEYVWNETQELSGFRAAIGAPLLRDSKVVGVIFIGKAKPEPFSEKQIELVTTFADQAVIAIENARLFNETQEALERQTATADILKVIASSPNDVQPVFQAIAERSNKLVNGLSAAVYRLVDGVAHLMAFTRVSPAADAVLQAAFPAPASELNWASAISKGKTYEIVDAPVDFSKQPSMLQLARQRGWRSSLAVPLMRDGQPIGLITVTRVQPGHFGSHLVQLLKTFADQAVIAIENVRLFNETKETLERQTATADILKVIASSPDDIHPVFEAIAQRSKRLVDALSTTVFTLIDGTMHLQAFTPTNREADTTLQAMFPAPVSSFSWGESISNGEIFRVADTDREPSNLRQIAQLRGFRSMLLVPLLREQSPVGLISVTRVEPGPFSDHHVQLLKTFADQAVIAIQNVKLFEEVQARTRDLQESLQQQTATADVLKVISRSAFDLEAVLDALLSSACRLCEADIGTIRYREGGEFRLAATFGAKPEWTEHFRKYSTKPDRSSVFGRTIVEGHVVHIPDLLADPDYDRPAAQKLMGFRAALGVPLTREGETFGVINLFRFDVGSFDLRQIELVQTFADQAVIAIENVRLFDEVQAKTRDLSEALTYQTGSGNILSVIASSPTDVGPVLKAIVESACELCGAYDAIVRLKEGDHLVPSAHHGPIPTNADRWLIERKSISGLAVIDRKPVHIRDMQSSEGDQFPESQRRARELGHRTILSVPLLREGESIGVIVLRRTEAEPFADKQIGLLQTFADQAVIAIGNVRLFEQVRDKTRELTESLQQQTATSDVLQVISSSPGELAPVFEKMLVNATRVCGAEFGSLLLTENGSIRVAAQCNVPAEFAIARGNRVLAPHPNSPLAMSIRTKQVVHEADLRTTQPYRERHPGMLELVELGGVRTIAIVPMLRDEEVIGAISVYRNEVQLFSDKQIDLLSNFAKQAVIAIENARLLTELRQRTADLSQSLDDLRTAQDRLVQTEKLASLGQLTAGIAHEIKNPLNFVNNFSALSAELTGELNEVLKPVAMDGKVREEVDELTGMLKGNLAKVVQHGKRADSIVKNMLLHSREGSGELRAADINSLVEESLNLAYHGARAEKPGFAITLKHDLDPDAGALELYPQEITRALLNLISNGFYAATKRKAENGEASFEPTLSATTKNHGASVEICIRDNGAGIPPEVKEKMFNPFFTTKPAGEGTGLGLSMTHDIIVKQHGGRIDVATEAGQFTEFKIVLPRSGAKQ